MNDTVAIALVAALPGTIAAFAAIINAVRTQYAMQSLRIEINHRLTDYIAEVRTAARAAGVKQESDRRNEEDAHNGR